MRITNTLKAIAIAIKARGRWLHAYDFNNYGGIFIGHRGCARISDASKKYPEMIEVMRDPDNPRMYLYRFKIEATRDFLPLLDKDVRNYIESELRGNSVPYTRKVHKAIINPETRSVRFEWVEEDV